MNAVQLQLLRCLKAYRLGQETAETTEYGSAEDWQALYELAGVHKLRPVVYETLRSAPGFCGKNTALATAWKQETLLQAVSQAGRTQLLLALTHDLEEAGIRYAVVKGALCRALYAKPDLRLSGDEDIFIASKDRNLCGEIFARHGLKAISPEEENDVDHWQDPRTGLHIELHTRLFSPAWPAEAVLTPYFAHALGRTVPAPVDTGILYTLDPTDHFVFLISHALKHFIAGGFGVRTACDILSFAQRYDSQIHRDTVYSLLEQIHGRVFFEQLLALGEAYLGFDPAGWQRATAPDFDELLEDMLDAGIYGQTSMDRRHSAALSLRATQSGDASPSLRAALFPPVSQLKGRYPILRRAPILLPAVWLHRMGRYALEVLQGDRSGSSPRETIALGKRRTEMMVKYGILPQGKTENC